MYTNFMNDSILIYGSNKQSRLAKIEELIGKKIEKVSNNPDFLIIKSEESRESIGIDQVREAIKFFQEKPFTEKSKTAVVLEANKMTVQAQNAFLKTLEEPPVFAQIILEATTENSLLETVVSRCKKQKINLTNAVDKNDTFIDLKELLEMHLGERVDWADTNGKLDKEELVQILEKWIIEGRNLYLNEIEKNMYSEKVKKLVKMKAELENTNINKKLALVALVLNL